MAATREDLHRLVDELPEAEVPVVRRHLEAVLGRNEDPVLRALREAPIDDEPETPEEREATREALDAAESGDAISHEDLKRELDL